MSLTSSRTTYESMTFAPFGEHFAIRASPAASQKTLNVSGFPNDNRPNTAYLRDDAISPHFNPIAESLTFGNATVPYGSGIGNSFGWMTETMDTLLKTQTTDFQDHALCSSTPANTYNLSTTTPASNQLYLSGSRRPVSCAPASRTVQRDNFSAVGQQSFAAAFAQDSYHDLNGSGYDLKPLFLTNRSMHMNVLSGTTVRQNTDNNVSNTLVPVRAIGANQTLSVSAASPMTSSVMMTPDSSTIGFRLGASSDDGEISPTPTNSSSQPPNSARIRKAAPTLATGRRNLKAEPVDPDEADRRMKRRERNRKSAQKCRERKVQRTHELQAQVECLQMEANRLTQELEKWRAQARQCVALLHMHCPGVSIPYMSCLTEEVMQTDAMKLEEPAMAGWKMKVDRKTPSPVDARNSKMLQNHNANNNVAQKNRKTSTGNNYRPSDLNSSGHESFSTLPTMVSLHSHIAPNRTKSLFPFADDTTPGSEMQIDTLLPSLGSLKSRENSQMHKTPVTSVSLCSKYKLAFTNFQQPMQSSVLIDAFDNDNTTNTDEESATAAVVAAVLGSSEQLPMLNLTQPTKSNALIGMDSCSEWNPPSYLANVESSQLNEAGSVSSISSSPQLNSNNSSNGYVGHAESMASENITDSSASTVNVLCSFS